MRTAKEEEHGRQTRHMDGTYALHQSITDATLSIAKTRKAKEFQTQYISNTST
jgi:hypothetical protein